MNRRQFLIASAAVTATTVGGIATARALRPGADLAALAAELEALRGRALATTTGWSPFKVLSHLAQSIELSLSGYPQLKSAFFRHSAGPAAFSVFAAAGAMRHPLTEAIPPPHPRSRSATHLSQDGAAFVERPCVRAGTASAAAPSIETRPLAPD